MEQEGIQVIVLDTGGDTIKTGFNLDSYPCTVFPNVRGRFRVKSSMLPMGMPSFIGSEALQNDLLIKTYPIENGLIRDWDAMEEVWVHAFYRSLCIQPEEHPVLLTEPPICPKANREKMTQIMFETFNTPAIYICSSSLLSLNGTGRVTGLVVETGHSASFSVPIWKNYSNPHAILRQDISGTQLTDYFTKSLTERNLYTSHSKSDRNMIRHIKEKFSFLLLDYKHDIKSTINECIYQLPDGNRVSLGDDLARIPETLFQPSLCSVYSDQFEPNLLGVHESVYASINKCDNDIRKHLYNNIVLSGGNSLISGFRNRLEKEISLLSSHNNRIRVIAPKERKHLAWIGGASLASLSTFNSMWISKQEYDESGPSICNARTSF